MSGGLHRILAFAVGASLALGLQFRSDPPDISSESSAVEKCFPLGLEPAKSCAAYRKTNAQKNVVITSMVKDTVPVDLVRQLEYHFLLGADLAILFDNSCPSESSDRQAESDGLDEALRPYIEKGLVIFRTEYRCVDPMEIYPQKNPIGGSGLALQIVAREKELNQRRNTLMLALDDDEYVVMNNASQNLLDLRHFLLHADDPSASLEWLMYGSSGYVCQPSGSVVRHFTQTIKPYENMTESERENALQEAHNNNLNEPFGKRSHKFAITWQSAEYIQRCDTHNCGIPIDAAKRADWFDFNKTILPTDLGGNISPKTDLAFIAHYAYQSEQRWQFKKARGRTTDWATREGSVPKRYNDVTTTMAWDQLVARIDEVTDRKLRVCLADMFGKDHSDVRRVDGP